MRILFFNKMNNQIKLKDQWQQQFKYEESIYLFAKQMVCRGKSRIYLHFSDPPCSWLWP
jgi:hypothetical protein